MIVNIVILPSVFTEVWCGARYIAYIYEFNIILSFFSKVLIHSNLKEKKFAFQRFHHSLQLRPTLSYLENFTIGRGIEFFIFALIVR